MKIKNKKILWLTDYTVKEVPAGGAEITDSHILFAANRIGLSVTVKRPQNFDVSCLSNYDFAIFSNNYEFSIFQRNFVMANIPYIVYSHDSGRWLNIFKTNPDISRTAIGSIFLSPLHRDQFLPFIKNLNNIYCVPPYISKNFIDTNKKRNNKVMYAGNIHEGKGLWEVLSFVKKNKGIDFDFYSHRTNSRIITVLKNQPNCNLMGFIPNSEIFKKYNEYSYFIHVPLCKEAFGRAVTEAYLCGCNIICNNNIGAFSYTWDFRAFRRNTLYANYDFWFSIEKIIKFL